MVERTTVTLRVPRIPGTSARSRLFSTSFIINDAPDENIMDFADAVNDLQTVKYTEVLKSTQSLIFNN